jgi:hypothetical protein
LRCLRHCLLSFHRLAFGRGSAVPYTFWHSQFSLLENPN